MTALIALVRKDLILYLSDKRALMMHLLLPVVLAAFFGSLFGGGGGNGHNGKVEVGLVQIDQSDLGRKIGAGLKTESMLHVTELSVEEARARVKAGKLPVAVLIPAGFGEQAGQALFGGPKPELPLLYDPSQSMMLAMVKGLLSQQVMQAASAAIANGQGGRISDEKMAQLQLAARADPDQAQLSEFLGSLRKYQDQRAARTAAQQAAQAGQTGAASAAASASAASAASRGLTLPFTTDEQALSSGPRYNGYAHSFAGMGVQFILFMGVDMGIAILLARRQGMWSRLLAAPVSLSTLLLSRAASSALIALGLMCSMFLCAVLGFQVQITSLVGFLGIALSFALMTAGFGLLIAAFGKTPEAARGIAVFVTLIMVMLGGAWVPAFLFPEWMQSLTLVMPTRWAVDGFDGVTWRGLDLAASARAMAVLLGFALAFGGLALWKFQRDQRK